jgi:hypothetical protein
MGLHIHIKNGKFNIWSTVTDSYFFASWVNEETVKKTYIDSRIYEENKRATEAATEMVANAKTSGFCGLEYMKCEPKTFEKLRRLNHEC